MCNEEKLLIKAHIIPEGFFRPLRHGSTVPEMHSNTEGVFPKRSPIGVYDKNILCEKCDKYLGLWDEYAHKLLIQDFSERNAVYNGSTKAAYRINSYDYKKLKLFFLSLLWRASISSQPFYKRIEIGAHENILKEMIRNNNPGEPYDYAVSLAKFSDPRIKEMLDPHKTRLSGINYCQLYLTGFVLYIKTDKRKPPAFLEELCLQRDPPFWILLRDVNESNDGKILKSLSLKAIRHKSEQGATADRGPLGRSG